MNELWKEFKLFIVKHSGKYINWQALKGWTNFGKDGLNWSPIRNIQRLVAMVLCLDRHIWNNEE